MGVIFLQLNKCPIHSPVAGVFGAGVVRSYNHKDMLKVWADVLGAKGLCSRLLKHDCDDVVSDVSFP